MNLVALLFVCLCLLVFEIVSDQVPKLDAVSLETIINNKHLRKEGFKEFSEAVIHEIHPSNGRNIVNPAYLHRRRRSLADTSNSTSTTIQLQLQVFNQTIDLWLKYNNKLLQSKSPVFIRGAEDSLEVWQGENPDCFLEGTTSRQGAVSLTYCNGITGSVTEGSTMYRLDPLEPLHDGFEETVLVSKGDVIEGTGGAIDQTLQSAEQIKDSIKERQKRAVQSTSFTIEIGIYLDAVFWGILETKYNAMTTAEKITMVVLKWNGVQAMFDLMVADLGYTVTIEIKSIEFWQTDPGWYTLDAGTLDPNLASFCSGTLNRVDILPVDVFFLHTGSDPNRGLAYTPGQCTGNRCAIGTDQSFYSFYIPAHELGHTLGMLHDDDTTCGTRPDSGIMQSVGKYQDLWSTCSEAYLTSFLQTSKATCLFNQDVTPDLVDATIRNIQLTPGQYPGMVMSRSEYCDRKGGGSGWEYRPWYSGTPACSFHSCINMNPGANYGTMLTIALMPSGFYCAEGSLCLNSACMTYADAGLDVTALNVVTGAWSEWGAASACTRTCGTGLMVRKRTCDNPRPSPWAPCAGSAYHAETCNTDACTGDSAKEATLIKERAAETCGALVTNGILSSAEYDGTGTKYSSSTPEGQCEVKCTLQSGVTFNNPHLIRYGLMPDGTPCTSDSSTYNDNKGYPRGTGTYGLCTVGYCRTIGCDGTTSSMANDVCGVCGGDTSTCTPVDGINTDTFVTGRSLLVDIPAGASQILFYFKWTDMKETYIEIYDTATDTNLFAATKRTSDRDTRTNPPTLAGARWYSLWYTQYLYTFDTITENITIKVFNKDGVANAGITYGYSLPLDGATPPTVDPNLTTTPTPQPPTGSTLTPPPTPIPTSKAPTVSAPTSKTSAPTQTTAASCQSGFIRCDNGNCIHYTDLCNGVNDCVDNSDETNVLCGSDNLGSSTMLILLTLACWMLLWH